MRRQSAIGGADTAGRVECAAMCGECLGQTGLLQVKTDRLDLGTSRGGAGGEGRGRGEYTIVYTVRSGRDVGKIDNSLGM